MELHYLVLTFSDGVTVVLYNVMQTYNRMDVIEADQVLSCIMKKNPKKQHLWNFQRVGPKSTCTVLEKG